MGNVCEIQSSEFIWDGNFWNDQIWFLYPLCTMAMNLTFSRITIVHFADRETNFSQSHTCHTMLLEKLEYHHFPQQMLVCQITNFLYYVLNDAQK